MISSALLSYYMIIIFSFFKARRLHAGFFLLHYMHLYRKHLQRLVGAWRSGRLHVALDPTPFKCAASFVS